MSVLPVRQISLVARRCELDSVMVALQTAGVMHISNEGGFHDDVLVAQIDECQKKLSRLRLSIDFLQRFQATPDAIPPKGISAEKLLEKVYALYEQDKVNDEQSDFLKQQIQIYGPFGDFTRPDFGDLGLSLKLARLHDQDLAAIKTDHVAYQVIAREKDINLVAIISNAEAKLDIATFDPSDENLWLMRDKLAKTESLSLTLKAEASRWAYQLRALVTLEELTKDRMDRLVELNHAKDAGFVVGISGFVLLRDIHELKKVLTQQQIAFVIEEPTLGNDIPVQLKNPRMLRGFEAIVKSFTGINYFEKDKTSIVSFLFMTFGSLCLLDAGYGFLLMVAGYVVAIKKHRDFGQVFMWTGAMTVVLGLLCGQVFGLTFAKDIMHNIPPLLSLATDPMVCFKFSLGIGVFAIALSNTVAIYQNGINTHATGCLLAILGGVILAINHSEILHGQFVDPSEVLIWIAVSFFSLAVFSWLLFPEPVFGKSHLGNVLWMLYAGPLGVVQDVLSHMRLFGIALSGSILAMVINKICAQLPTPFGLLFAPIGHFTVFLLSLLSLYIHSNRLIFLEFGSKCMKGGNHYFKPFARRT